MIKRYVKEGFGKTGTRMRIGRAIQALTFLLSATFLDQAWCTVRPSRLPEPPIKAKAVAG